MLGEISIGLCEHDVMTKIGDYTSNPKAIMVVWDSGRYRSSIPTGTQLIIGAYMHVA